jgi:2,3-bisphosphoglycerate-dependent phosphoglycerate mutase
MRLFIIRHGETEYNKLGLIQGNFDSKLTETGMLQSSLVAQELAKTDLDFVFSSIAERAHKTAQPIAVPRCLPVALVPTIRERAYGIFEGKSLEETKKHHPEIFATGPNLDLNAKPKDGESIREVSERVIPFVERMKSHFPDKNVAIVAHGIVNKIIIGHLLDNSFEKIGGYKQPNACINEILFENGKAQAIRLSYTEHLKKA